MIRSFGLLLVVGVAAICFVSYHGGRSRPSASASTARRPRRADYSEGRLGRLVVWLGSVPASLALILVVVSVVVFVVGSVVEPKLKLETDPVNWVDQDSQVIKDIREVEREVGGSSELGVFVQSTEDASLYTDEVVTWMDEFTRDQLAAHRGAGELGVPG